MTSNKRTRRLGMARGAGFTLVELMVAMGLGVVVVAGAMALLFSLGTMTRASEQQLDDMVNARVTHIVVGRVMQSLIGGAPEYEIEYIDVDDGAEADADADEETLGGDRSERRLDGSEASQEDADQLNREREDESLQDMVDGFDEDDAAAQAASREVLEDQFVLLFEDHGGEGDERVLLQSVEVVVHSAPLRAINESEVVRLEDEDELREREDEDNRQSEGPRNPVQLGTEIRGVFEVAEYVDGWAFQWRQTEPALEPEVLMTGITLVEWRVLPPYGKSADWPTVYSAYLTSDFPLAVRLILGTESGQIFDWLFETSVVQRGQDGY